MRPPFLEALFRTSFSEVAPPSSNSDPHSSVEIAREHSGRPAGSPMIRTLKSNNLMMPSPGYSAHGYN